MLIGYARVSTLEQTLALQQDALTQAGCERLFTDTASGSQDVRPGLTEALDFARPGDTLRASAKSSARGSRSARVGVIRRHGGSCTGMAASPAGMHTLQGDHLILLEATLPGP